LPIALDIQWTPNHNPDPNCNPTPNHIPKPDPNTNPNHHCMCNAIG